MPEKYTLTNAKDILLDAKKNKYAVPHVNINNLEWTKNILVTANELRSPVILGTSMGAIKYMGGFKTVASLVKSLVSDLKISVPVVLHLDHGDFESCFKAIEAGFTSVMFDGSMLSMDENLERTKAVVEFAKRFNVSVEAEVGAIGGEEDGIASAGVISNVSDALKMKETGIDVLAAGIGNIHGKYPESWKSLDFETLSKISNTTDIGIVLHGGSGIPTEQVVKAISLGVTKINVNTELQLAFADAVEKFVLSGESKKGKNFDPRKLLATGCKAICETVKEKIVIFNSQNRY
ncbi:class II fructose-1,6-bisphosphate aldolase [Mycoplasmopsis bovis]|uniref:Class II fructose-1,6-bisphosphate aldolase n=1 Tax=Mycoplasmopsis bovis TaxID=28903 RepID=A0ABY8RYU7_MYCBV|nr:class II fructose-1,6-bisphosphate aldolase [Mycoplasmopsis bovis]WHL54274.1 class II fructose-1,6-bisphosphate aldolase [Mycoplasmopsis bovis]WHO15710.1 class II fructose-1,6-bisphosphate aldolase [Mycoplasmopsis bovis]